MNYDEFNKNDLNLSVQSVYDALSWLECNDELSYEADERKLQEAIEDATFPGIQPRRVYMSILTALRVLKRLQQEGVATVNYNGQGKEFFELL